MNSVTEKIGFCIFIIFVIHIGVCLIWTECPCNFFKKQGNCYLRKIKKTKIIKKIKKRQAYTAGYVNALRRAIKIKRLYRALNKQKKQTINGTPRINNSFKNWLNNGIPVSPQRGVWYTGSNGNSVKFY